MHVGGFLPTFRPAVDEDGGPTAVQIDVQTRTHVRARVSRSLSLGLTPVNCPFCLSDAKSSKEHLFSRPICNAVGLDRSMLVASLDGCSSAIGPVSPLDQRAVRLPCEACNSGWMSDLESDAARTIRRWMSKSDERLTKSGVVHLGRWLVKTMVVLGFSESGSRQFMDKPTQTAIPDITTAKKIAAGSVPDGVVAGAARVNDSSMLWGTGNPTVVPSGPDRISCRAVNVAAFNLGSLQLWVAVPLVAPDSLRLPKGVTRLNHQLRSRSLRPRTSNLDPTQVVAEYSDRTTAAAFAGLEMALERSVALRGSRPT